MFKRGFGTCVRPLLEAGVRTVATAASTLVFSVAASWTLGASSALAADRLGQPTPGAIDLQPAASPMRHEAAFFHNIILTPIIVAICLFVLALLAIIVIKFNAKSNPKPARFTHNTTIEIIWTAAPVLILMFIAIFSFRLLYNYHNMPKPDVTIKVTGNQWYWAYEYPSEGIPEYTSNPLPEAKAEAKGPGLYRLAVDNPIVVPVDKTVQILATGADVLHAFFIPAFGVQTTTIPGRVNQAWFKADKTGVFYGQCNELCGVNHSFMPIEVDVVTQPQYAAWVAAHSKKAAPSTAAPMVAAALTPGAGQAAVPASSGAADVAPVGGVPAKPQTPAAGSPGAPPAAPTKASAAAPATPAAVRSA